MHPRLALSFLAGLSAIGPAATDGFAQSATEVRTAVKRGVEFLKSAQQPDGSFSGGYGQRLGGIALAGLALREGGVEANDPAVRRAAEVVRQQAPGDQNTYDVALSIMFLDKLTRSKESSRELRAVRGSAAPNRKKLKSGRILTGQQVADSELILDLTRRLQQGQGPQGSWTYACRSPADGDHSNTQFGVLGLWVGGQHGIPVADNLRRCAEHFRGCQSPEGGWAYGASGTDRSSMTAAGLIALAIGAGMETELRSSRNVRDIRSGAPGQKDPVIQSGLARLESFLATPPAGAGARPGGPFGRALGAFAARSPAAQDFYFLWSLERVGVLYGLKKVGKVDWYAWGARDLLATQQPNGSWSRQYGPEIETSFAILFLTRANVSPELSQLLAGKYGPGDAAMRSFAPGTDPMQELGLKATVAELLAALADASDADERTALVQELDARRPKYSAVKDQLEDIFEQAGSSDASVAQAARDQLTNAFQRAPMSHCLYYLGKVDEGARRLIWAQIDARIARADAARRAEYRDTAVKALGVKEFSTASRLAAIELLGKLNDTAAVGPVAELLPKLPRETWPAAGDWLRRVTGEDFGPRGGDAFAQVYEAAKQWKAWSQRQGDR